MDFLKFGEFAASLGPATWLIILLIFSLTVCGLVKKIKQIIYFFKTWDDERKNPKKLCVVYGDVSITLDRRWVDNEWRYVLNDLPVSFCSPEKEYNELDKNMQAPEDKWLDNFDALTKKDGPMDQATREYYNQPARANRRGLSSYFFRWRGIMPKVDLKAQQRKNNARRDEAMKSLTVEK